MNTPAKEYSRVTLRGELTCLADLHPGSGEYGLRGDNNETTINELTYDCAKRPIIAAASLRGYLHAQFNEDDPNRIALFGNANNTDDSGQAGALRLYDCKLLNHTPEWDGQLRSRVAIDAITRTAKDKQLFTDLLIPCGSQFLVEMELDNISESALNALLSALASLNPNNPSAQLGQGKSHGRGNVQWNSTTIKVLDQEDLQQWLLKPNTALDKADWKTICEKNITDPTSAWQRLELCYCFDSPVLINDPSIVKEGENEPDLRFMRRGNKLLIPGSSIKGLFRARARRILMTISEGNPAKTDELINEMFGGEDGMGTIRFYDATALFKENEIHEQTMIAIDRFTGGVKDGAMLIVEAAKPKYATGTIALDKHKIKPWQHALWLYCLRDAMEGDLALGWGQARGFGAFHITTKPNSGDHFCDWENYIAPFNKDELNVWTTDLEEKIKEQTA